MITAFSKEMRRPVRASDLARYLALERVRAEHGRSTTFSGIQVVAGIPTATLQQVQVSGRAHINRHRLVFAATVEVVLANVGTPHTQLIGRIQTMTLNDRMITPVLKYVEVLPAVNVRM